MRKIFDSKAGQGISNSLYKVRHKENVGSWILPQHREEIERKWNQEEWKKKAKTNSANRRASDLPMHTGGSVPTTEHLRRLVSNLYILNF
jgi:hypothetical protein